MRGLLTVGLGTSLLLGATAAGALLTHRPAPPAAGAAGSPVPRCQDADGDGFGRGCAAGEDCNDRDAAIHPGAVERCNFRDDDCSGLVDDARSCAVPPLDTRSVAVPAGAFTMGSTDGAADERPIHSVRLGAYRLDRYEVTNARYRRCVAAGTCTPPALGSSARRAGYYTDRRFDDYPVIFVSWQQADSFCRFARGRLPTEAEWEKAARGPATALRLYPWGNEPPSCALANLGGAVSCVGDTDRVGRRPLGQSPYGAMDMAGNVWEWVADWYQLAAYAHARPADPPGPPTGRLKVTRGGCWQSGADSLRVSCRKAELPATRAYNIGFRCRYPEGG